jgi:hypothetical protein
MYSINIWPILIATVVSFGIGAIWYSPLLFGKQWMNLMKMTEADLLQAREKGVWKSYIVHIIANFVSFCVLGFIVAAVNAVGGSDGAFFGFLAWLGFVLPLHISHLLWQKTPLKLILIDTFQILLGLVIGGTIIGLWK